MKTTKKAPREKPREMSVKKPSKKPVSLKVRREREGDLLVRLAQDHRYAFMLKPKINMVMDLKTREVTPHLEYRIVVPADSKLAQLIPFQGTNDFLAKARR